MSSSLELMAGESLDRRGLCWGAGGLRIRWDDAGDLTLRERRYLPQGHTRQEETIACHEDHSHATARTRSRASTYELFSLVMGICAERFVKTIGTAIST